MALVILGKRNYDFTNDKGQRFLGIKLHCRQEFSTPGEGYLTEVVSVGNNKPVFPTVESLPFGSVITPVYDRYGRIQDIILKSLPEDDKESGKK